MVSVAREGADDVGILHIIEREGRTVGHALDRLEHDEVLRAVDAQHALAEDGAELALKVELRLVRRHGVAVAAVTRRLLDEVQLLDIARDCRLCGLDATRLQRSSSCSWRLDALLADDLQELCLSFILHGMRPPFPFFYRESRRSSSSTGAPAAWCAWTARRGSDPRF